MLNIGKTHTKIAPKAAKGKHTVTKETHMENLSAQNETAPLADDHNMNDSKSAPESMEAPKASAGGVIKVQKGVPMPDFVGGGARAKYPWAEMEDGDSFFVPGGKIENFYTATSAENKKLKDKGIQSRFVARKMAEDGVAGVRVWRVPAA